MSSRHSTPIELPHGDLTSPQGSFEAPVRSAFDILGKAVATNSPAPRDQCFRPTPQYNDFYNPYNPPNLDKSIKYSP